ncbi:transforming growth factor beta regulator 1 [Sceloporus undulatus]|uniref:transforming growth factor beta regulator 1 n=1 Tax=Sceloporus undulatus TaxID=8520 RepID=UPI001C4D3238|nr:transforming growth factor beta regulator 1 [Sceloporus undulatus]XP_042327620.1 transforming growth factor beta regulator 1 [Sceloporus undulatus]XP_042327621.1 transforming growth factor beta regulator 1 [Sceloporus undulatus]
MKKNLRKNQGERYRLKFRRLCRAAKVLVYENAALCDEIARLEAKYLRVREERRFLLARLLQAQALAEEETPVSTITTISQPSPDEQATRKPRRERKGKENGRASKRRVAPELGIRRLVPPLPLDPSGRPVFPITLGPLTVYSLGEIVSDRSSFHTESAIYPVGYCSTRIFASTQQPVHRCLYTCQIKDGGTGPLFEIAPEDEPGCVITGSSPDTCHAQLLEAVGAAQLEPSGAEFFGLSHPAIQHLIQSCPGARKCAGYRWLRFEVCRPADGAPPEALPPGNPGTDFEAFQNQGLAGPVGLDFPAATPSPPSGNGYAELFLPCAPSGGSPVPQSPESDTD